MPVYNSYLPNLLHFKAAGNGRFRKKMELFNVKGLETRFKTREGTVYAVNGVSFRLKEGETLGIVGESGCGKSVSVMSTLGLIPTPPGKVVAGEALFQGRDLLKISREELRSIRGSQISMVFQDPMTSFNPVWTIGKQLSEPLRIHQGLSTKEAADRVVEILDLVGIPNARDRLSDYPHQFSGGMRQRAMIAMALICSPKILIADEPTTALDVTIQAQIVEMVKKLRDELGMAIIWITHDLGIVAGLADRVSVMYGGYVIEEAKVRELYENPRHPYTIGLLGSLPRMDETGYRRLSSIEGLPPVLMQKPDYCTFAPRCPYRVDRCLRENPALRKLEDGHTVACFVDVDSGRESI
jgi:oligopeptide transport system ATP-binding protein